MDLLGLDEGDFSGTHMTLTIVKQDSQESLGVGPHQTKMSFAVLTECKAENFHLNLLDALVVGTDLLKDSGQGHMVRLGVFANGFNQIGMAKII